MTLILPMVRFMNKNNSLISLLTLSGALCLLTTGCGSSDDDGDGVLNEVDCAPKNAKISTEKSQDKDCDGLIDGDDCEPGTASSVSKKDDADCDGVGNDVDCAKTDPKIKTEKSQDKDCDGLVDTDDCDPENASSVSKKQDTDCDGLSNKVDCDPNGSVDDLDCDGVKNAEDCDPKNKDVKTTKATDTDCDGFLNANDCNPDGKNEFSKSDDSDCDGVENTNDCEAKNAKVATSKEDDSDCDGLANDDDCEPEKKSKVSKKDDSDCDGVGNDDDCDPNDKSIATTKKEDADCDGKPEIKVEAFSYVKKFKNMNELKQESTKEKFPGTILKGKGKIFEIGDCGWLDKSDAHGSGCYKITLDKGMPRVVLYFDDDKSDELENLSKGQKYSFDNCVATDITDWGFWATATCDMPE